MKYLILENSSTVDASNISKALWNIISPVAVRNSEDTLFYNSWFEHPTNGDIALCFLNESIQIHSQADITAFTNLMNNATVNISDTESMTMNEYLESLRGNTFNPLNMLEMTTFSQSLSTHSDLETNGYFESFIV